jgi:5-methylcytosine-specific restriction protein A
MKPGEVINNSTLRKTFSVGNMGGMRRSRSNNLLVIVSDHTKALYDDYWEGNVLHYTGMGLKGPQKLAFSQNRTLSEAQTSGVAVHTSSKSSSQDNIFMPARSSLQESRTKRNKPIVKVTCVLYGCFQFD